MKFLVQAKYKGQWGNELFGSVLAEFDSFRQAREFAKEQTEEIRKNYYEKWPNERDHVEPDDAIIRILEDGIEVDFYELGNHPDIDKEEGLDE